MRQVLQNYCNQAKSAVSNHQCIGRFLLGALAYFYLITVPNIAQRYVYPEHFDSGTAFIVSVLLLAIFISSIHWYTNRFDKDAAKKSLMRIYSPLLFTSLLLTAFALCGALYANSLLCAIFAYSLIMTVGFIFFVDAYWIYSHKKRTSWIIESAYWGVAKLIFFTIAMVCTLYVIHTITVEPNAPPVMRGAYLGASMWIIGITRSLFSPAKELIFNKWDC